MNDDFSEEVAFWMIQASLALGHIDLEKMRQHIQYSRESRSYFDSMGPILDPTKYRQMQSDGSLEDAKLQGEIAAALLAAREAIEKREAHADKFRIKDT